MIFRANYATIVKSGVEKFSLSRAVFLSLCALAFSNETKAALKMEKIMKNGAESEKVAEIRKLLEIAYVEAMYESLEETAGYIKVAVDSLAFENFETDKTRSSAVVVEFTQRKMI